MNDTLTLLGKAIRLLGRAVKFLATLMTWCGVISLMGFAYSLINKMIPQFAYQIMLRGGFLGGLFTWYYVHVYLAFPWVQVITYFITTWGGAILVVLFRVLHQVLNFLATKLIAFGTGIMNKGLVAKAKAQGEQNAAVVQELERQMALNQQLQAQNQQLRHRRALQVQSGQNKKRGFDMKGYIARMKQKEAEESADQEDAWGRWSRRK